MDDKKDILIEKVTEYCPICEKEHELEKRKRDSQLRIKDQIINYKEIYFRCTNTSDEENEFVTAEMLDNNLLEAKDKYREKNNLLTSKEIKKIRKKYNLTQKEFSFLLGLGEITITRYEKKLIQDVTYDRLMRLINDNALLALDYLRENKEKFKNKKRYDEIEENIKRVVIQDTVDYFNKEEFKSRYVNFENKSDMNGFKNVDIAKIEAVINYIAKNNDKLYKVKLMKLLWYIDMLYYKKYNQSLTGLVYVHQKLGALPVGFDEIMKFKSIKIEEETKNEKNDISVIYHIIPNKNYETSDLSKEEREVINNVLNKFKDFNTSQIVEYMHNEKAYKNTNQNEVIKYTFAKDISI